MRSSLVRGEELSHWLHLGVRRSLPKGRLGEEKEIRESILGGGGGGRDRRWVTVAADIFIDFT